MITTIAKLYCSAINQNQHDRNGKTTTVNHFNAVYSPDPTSENYSWSKATPSGTARLVANNSMRVLGLTIGQFYTFEIIPNPEGQFHRVGHEVELDGKRIQVRIESVKSDTETVSGIPCTTYRESWLEMTLWVDNQEAWPCFESERFDVIVRNESGLKVYPGELMPMFATEGDVNPS